VSGSSSTIDCQNRFSRRISSFVESAIFQLLICPKGVMLPAQLPRTIGRHIELG
jgi:hypothetical protein